MKNFFLKNLDCFIYVYDISEQLRVHKLFVSVVDGEIE